MIRGEWDALVQQFLHHRPYAQGTREGYTLALQNLSEWSDAAGVSPLDAGHADMLAFREWLVGRKLSDNTVNTRFKGVRAFYEYLRKEGRIAANPTLDIKAKVVGLAARDRLTLEELARMWEASAGRERIIIGLLGICSLRRDEVRSVRVEDLHERQGTVALHVRVRDGRLTDLGYVALPDQLASEVQQYLNGRRTGLILQADRGGSDEVAATYINHVVKRTARRAGIPFDVTSITLTHTLRWISMENRFSYASVVRTASHGSVQLRNAWVRNLDLPPEEHASILLGRMLAARSSEDAQMLLRADILLADRSQHPAAAVVMASATLERVLREVTKAMGIAVTKKDPSLSTYATLLKSKDLITIGQLRTLERVLGFRNDAAHGWFELVGRDDAEWVMREARQLVSELRAIPSP